MARASTFVAGLVLGLALGTVLLVHAAAPDDPDVAQAAEIAGVAPDDLAGAVNTTGMDPASYLCRVGEGDCPSPPPAPAAPARSSRVACIIAHESGGDPNATNASSKAAGLGQFLWSTWATTPQGRAGLSPYNPAANAAAIQYMLDAGRGREFVAVSRYGC
jgi:hypothetical protein